MNSIRRQSCPAWWFNALLLGVVLMLGGCGTSGDDSPEKAEVEVKGEVTSLGTTKKLRPAQHGEIELEASPPFLRPIAEPGRWRKYRTDRFDESLSAEQRQQISQLESIGYLSGSRDAAGGGGVLTHDVARAEKGFNFYTSGHGTEATLMAMDGEVLHRWHYEFWDAWPDYPIEKDHAMTEFWRRTYLYPNGDILAIHEGLGVVRLDKESNLIWAIPNRAHHDLEILPNGEIYLLTREARMLPRIHPTLPVLEDFLVVLSDDGRETSRISLLEALERGDYGDLADIVVGRDGDVFHTNSVRVLDGRAERFDPAFRRGNVLLYILGIGVIAVLDLETETIVWARREAAPFAHDPTILENGNLLIFVNFAQGNFTDETSNVIEYAGLGLDVAWKYEGTSENEFQSSSCGSATRLPGGGTLIVESDGGRAFEVSPEGEVVWEFANRNRAGPNGRYVATLFDLERIPEAYVSSWLDSVAEELDTR